MKRLIIIVLFTAFFSAMVLRNAHPVWVWAAPAILFGLMVGLFLGKKAEAR